MYKKIVVISRSLLKNEAFKNDVQQLSDKVEFFGSASNEQEVIASLQGADAVIAGLPPFTQKVLNSLPELKVISNYGVGLDNIDLLAAKECNIKIGWEAGVNKSSVAQIVLGRSIDLMRGMSFSHQQLLQNNWINPKGPELSQATIGILGLGAIGKEVAKIFHFFGAKIIAYDIFPDHDFAKEYNIEFASSLEQVFSQSSIVTCHLPYTKQTHHLVDESQIKHMRKDAILINTSRGGIVQEAHLYEALKNKSIHGAALDVFEEEPLLNSPLLELPNFLASAHICGTSQKASNSMAQASLRGLKKHYSVDEIFKMNPWMTTDC